MKQVLMPSQKKMCFCVTFAHPKTLYVVTHPSPLVYSHPPHLGLEMPNMGLALTIETHNKTLANT